MLREWRGGRVDSAFDSCLKLRGFESRTEAGHCVTTVSKLFTLLCLVAWAGRNNGRGKVG